MMQRQRIHRFLRSALALALSLGILASSTPVVFAQNVEDESEAQLNGENTTVSDVTPSSEPTPEPTPEPVAPPETVVEGTEAVNSTEEITVTGLHVEDYWLQYDASTMEYNYHPLFTVTFSDGHTTEPTTEAVGYQGTWYYLDVQDGQVHGQPWQVGDYTATASLQGIEGMSATYTVHVVESLVTSFEAQDVEIIEQGAGSWYTYVEGDAETWYYVYELVPTCTVTMADGSILEGDNGQIVFQGQSYYLTCWDDQSYENQWKPGIHQGTLSLEELGVEDTFEVRIQKFPAVSIQAEDLLLVKGVDADSGGEWVETPDGQVEWVEYPYYGKANNISITLEDETVLTGDYYITYEGQDYWIQRFDDQSYENQWDVGKHQVTACVLGQEVTYTVTVVEGIVDHIQFDEISMLVGENGWEESTPEGTYYKYNYTPQGTVTLVDGTEVEFYGNGIDYNGRWYSMDYNDDQSFANPWGPGKHEVAFTLAGYQGTFTVNIIETYIQSVQMEDVVLQELSSGGFVTENGTEYWRYSLPYDTTATVTMVDGSTETLSWNNNGFYYDGSWYPMEVEDGQSGATPWGAGDHEVTATIMNFTFTFTVTVEEGLAQSLEVEDVTLIQNTSGNWDDDWNGTDKETYWNYYYNPGFKVTLKDGTELTSSGGGLEYEGQWYSPLFDDGQSGSTPWGVGTHQVRAILMGQVATFTVTIVETPVQSIDTSTVGVVENTCGYSTESQGMEWYRYDENKLFSDLTIHLKDGTQLVCTNNYVLYQGQYYDLTVSSGQSYENQWQVGNTYDVEVSVLGYTTTIQVSILEQEDTPFEYMVQNGQVYITGCQSTEENLVVPDTLSGLPVVAVLDLGDAMNTVKTLTIGDGVRTVSLSFGSRAVIEAINFGSGVEEFSVISYDYDFPLQAINVSEENQVYASVDGVLYDKEVKTLLYYPLARGNTYYVPDSVENIDLIFQSQYSQVNPIFADHSTAFILIDGVLYNKEMTKVLRCDRTKTGAYDMPDTVEEIAESAFANCDQLTSVDISSKVTTIVYCAFLDCDALATVTMPDSVTEIHEYAFSNCIALEEIALPEELALIGDSAFKSSGLRSVVIPNRMEIIDAMAFARTPLAQLDLGNSVESIGYEAFASTQLREVHIPDSVTYLASYAFSNCSMLMEVSFGSGLTEIGTGAFFQCGNLDNVTLPANITTVGSSAFAQCVSLENLEIQGEAVTLGDSAFENSSLVNYTPGVNIVATGWRTFAGTRIRSAVIGKTVTSITYGLFEDCTDLAEITVPKEVLDVDGHSMDNTKWYNDQADGPIYLEHVFYGYKGEMPANTTLDVRPGTLSVANYALENQQNLVGVTLPQGLIRIGNDAFSNALNLKSVNIPLGVTEIGNYAFVACVNLREVTIPRTVTEIGWDVFNGCSGLTIYGEAGSYAQQYANNYGIPFVAIPVMEDTGSESGVQVSVPENTFTDEVTLVAEVVENEADQPEITYPDTVEVQNSLVIDISFQNQDGTEVQPAGEVTVSIPVPETMDGEQCVVYHVLDDGTVEKMDAVYSSGYMVFTTDRFSYYVLAWVKPVGMTVNGVISGGLTDVTVELYDQDGQLVDSVTGSGAYTLEGVPAGTYTLKVSKANYATREYQITVGDSTLALDVELHLMGDIDGNGRVNTMDVGRVNAYVKQTGSMSEYELACADATGDGRVNTMDVGRINAHVKQTNPLW